jgi:hypothetical protein
VAQPTARPWTVSPFDKNVVCPISNPLFGIFTTSDEDEPTPEDEANAELIVRAVNSHDALLAACEMLTDIAAREGWIDFAVVGRAAIAAAKATP